MMLMMLGAALTTGVTAVVQTPCLCIFDIDRTLTGKQSDISDCPSNSIQAGIHDSGYQGGTLTLSALTVGMNKTFCKDCYKAAISAGTADGPQSPERKDLYQHLQHLLPTSTWAAAGCDIVNSPLVTSCQDGHKQFAVPKIIAWYAKTNGVTIADENVYFFDDRVENIIPFFDSNLKYNAHQISCDKRDNGGSIGLCGATLDEIQPLVGVTRCGAVDSIKNVKDDIVV